MRKFVRIRTFSGNNKTKYFDLFYFTDLARTTHFAI